MKKFKYELHTHTSEASRCSVIPGKELVRLYKKLGYQAICITDHFAGSSTISENTPWKERVELFCRGYENALEEGEKIGIKVFFGWEHCYDWGTDFLIYGLDKKWLLDHEGILNMDFGEFCKSVRNSGGYIVQAHPFREGLYIGAIRLLPWETNAVEVINANRTDDENARALWYAEQYDLKKISGSDTHSAGQTHFAYMSCDKKIDNIHDFIAEMDSGNMDIGTICKN